MAKFTRRRGEQIQEDIQKQERKYKSTRIDEAIQRGYEHLWNGEPAKVVHLMRDILIPDLGLARHNLRRQAARVTDSAAELDWNHEAVRRFLEDPDRYLEIDGGGPSDTREQAGQLYMRAAGMRDPRERRRDELADAFHSLESLAVARGFVSNSVTNWAPAMGYDLQMGTWYQPPRDDMPYEIQLVNPGDSEEVTINMGKPGRGKGVMGHTETEDRYSAGRKIVDLVDFDECEGAVYDLPNRNPTLREAREDMGLPPDFTEHEDYEPPEVEIMVPLTNGLADAYIPYYGDGPMDTVVRPFTVPASRLSKRALKRFISAELTPTQENVFESAYDQIQRSREDWNLHDLIMAVEQHRGLHGNQGAVDRVQRAIKRIQSKGWIRDRDDPHSIDWTRILTDPDTITVFTASLMDDTDESAKYLFHSYVIYALRTEVKRLKSLPEHERDGWDHVPKLTAILRELHKIAPSEVAAVDDSSLKQVQDAMTDDFRDLTAMHRHEGVEIISDTQNFIGEIKARARKNYNRAALFQVNYSDAVGMFKEVSGVTTDRYAKRVTQRFGVGECAVLGRVGTGRPFEMTVSVAPPMSHHFDPDEWYNVRNGLTLDDESLKERLGGTDPARANPDGWKSVNSGWDLRVFLGDEEYRPASELLSAAGVGDEPGDTDLKTIRAKDRRPESGPGQFAWDCLELAPEGRVVLDRLEAAYNAYADEHGHPERYDKRSVLCKQILNTATREDADELYNDHAEHARPVVHSWDDGKQQTAVYRGIELSDEGEQYAPDHPDEEPAEGGANPGDDGGETTEDAPDERDEPAESDTDGDEPEPEPEPEDEGPDLTVDESVTEGMTALMDGEPSDASSGTATAPEDALDPASDDMGCCDHPEPVPMYAGDERDQQVGWKCEACGQKEWDR
jgi:hypothetical protein